MTDKKNETPPSQPEPVASSTSPKNEWPALDKKNKTSAAAPEDIADWAVVVDDSSTSVNVIAGVLKGLNLGIHTFRSASAALKYLREMPDDDFNKIAVVFSDMDMPNMNGLEFLTEIRKEPRLKNMHFVIISGQVDRSTLTQFALMKIDGYIVKPFKAQSIIDRVTHALTARQKEKATGS